MADHAESGTPCKKMKLDTALDDDDDILLADNDLNELTSQPLSRSEADELLLAEDPLDTKAKASVTDVDSTETSTEVKASMTDVDSMYTSTEVKASVADETSTEVKASVTDVDSTDTFTEVKATVADETSTEVKIGTVPPNDDTGLPVHADRVLPDDGGSGKGVPLDDGGGGGKGVPPDDGGDSDSSVSVMSNLSGLSGEASWRAPAAGPMAWVYRSMEEGVDPRTILRQVIPDENMIPDLDDLTLWKMVINIVSEPPPRSKLPNVNTLAHVISLIKTCKKIMVLTGAGVSVSCGIPDFRSRNGIYARLAIDFPDLPDPQAMFDIRYFKRDQRPFFKFAKEIFPGQFEPSKCHKFIQLIEEHGKLLRNYTQNIDTLEQVAGIKNIIQCHGSFATATCMACSHKCSGDDIKTQINNQVIPMCTKCALPDGSSVMKPDIVFFGENLPEEFHDQMTVDKDDCDLLIVIGSSLKVRPVALIPDSLPAHVPQILINKEPLRNLNFDVELLGDCDTIVGELCHQLGEGWDHLANKDSLKEIPVYELLTPPASPIDKVPSSFTPAAYGDTSKSSIYHNTAPKSLSAGMDSKNSNTAVKPPSIGSIGDSRANKKDAISENTASVTVKTGESDTAIDLTRSPNVKSDIKDKNNESGTGGKTDSDAEKTSKTLGVVSDSTEMSLGTSTSGSDVVETDKGEKQIDTTAKSAAVPAEKYKPSAKPGTSGDISEMRNVWKPNISRISVAKRLAPRQYCFIPPSRYVFSEAEVFTIVDSSDSDSDLDDDGDTSFTDRDTTSESARDTSHNLDSSGAVIDLTSDDEEEKKTGTEQVQNGAGDKPEHAKETVSSIPGNINKKVVSEEGCQEKDADVKSDG